MIKPTRFLLVFIITFCCATLSAQQDAQFTQYMFNSLYYNPAYAGMSDGTELTAIHRSQWLGYEGTVNNSGAPSTQMISINSPLTQISGGVGLFVSNDNLGPTNNLDIQLSLARQLKLKNGATLSIGIRGGLYASRLNFDELVFVDTTEPLGGLSGNESQMKPDIGVGLFYRKGNFFGGLSANHLLEPAFDFGEDQVSNQLNRHYYLSAGYDYRLSSQFTITPTFLLKSLSLDTYNLDLSVIGQYNEKLSVGLAYRQSESSSAMVGYKVLSDRSLTIGYAFDFVMVDNQAKEPTSHELMLIYNFKSKGAIPRNPKGRIIRTPRYRY